MSIKVRRLLTYVRCNTPFEKEAEKKLLGDMNGLACFAGAAVFAASHFIDFVMHKDKFFNWESSQGPHPIRAILCGKNGTLFNKHGMRRVFQALLTKAGINCGQMGELPKGFWRNSLDEFF